jgi:hypothetical protein
MARFTEVSPPNKQPADDAAALVERQASGFDSDDHSHTVKSRSVQRAEMTASLLTRKPLELGGISCSPMHHQARRYGKSAGWKTKHICPRLCRW